MLDVELKEDLDPHVLAPYCYCLGIVLLFKIRCIQLFSYCLHSLKSIRYYYNIESNEINDALHTQQREVDKLQRNINKDYNTLIIDNSQLQQTQSL